MDIIKFLKRMFCAHTAKSEIYTDLEGWGELHYLYVCDYCGKEWYK